jgi:hypothetical protein
MQNLEQSKKEQKIIRSFKSSKQANHSDILALKAAMKELKNHSNFHILHKIWKKQLLAGLN